MCNCDKPTPNIKNIAQGIMRLASDKAGITQTSDKALERLTICNSCDYLTDGGQCSLCLCFVGAKVRVPNEKCPHTPPKW